MTLYETIFTRRSVRQYDEALPDAATLSEIQRHLDSVEQLPGQSARFEIVGRTNSKAALRLTRFWRIPKNVKRRV
jgi:nitroreductase